MDQKRHEVAQFLREFKELVTEGRGLDVVSRRKNIDSLAELGLTRSTCREEILALSVTDYCAGPEPDHDRPGYIWEFGKIVNNQEVYMKLKIATVGRGKIAKCISFHKAEYPLVYPWVQARKKGSDE